MKQAVIVDIDGTVADLSHRLHFIEKKPKDWDGFHDACEKDTPIHSVVDLVRYLQNIYHVVFVSSRMERNRQMTTEWLRLHGLCWYTLLLRKNGDLREDYIVKAEIYEEHLKGLPIAFVLEDRSQVVKMWRSKGLTCFQVADGDF